MQRSELLEAFTLAALDQILDDTGLSPAVRSDDYGRLCEGPVFGSQHLLLLDQVGTQRGSRDFLAADNHGPFSRQLQRDRVFQRRFRGLGQFALRQLDPLILLDLREVQQQRKERDQLKRHVDHGGEIPAVDRCGAFVDLNRMGNDRITGDRKRGDGKRGDGKRGQLPLV